MTDAETTFESEGTLQLGPQHCARLDLHVRTARGEGRWLVVSDGHALARVIQIGSGEPEVDSQPLLAESAPPSQAPAKPAAEVLRDKGCGGPAPLLSDLRDKLTKVEVQPGLWKNKPMLRVGGELDRDTLPKGADTAIAAAFCYVYLDAQTLWPHRLEWLADAAGGRRPILQMEFRDPELNRELSLPECIREFSYQPQAGG
jgi:hypothetical protein